MVSKQRAYQLRYPDRDKARHAVYVAVRAGRLDRARDCRCTDCGGQARDYDHYLGYALEHRLDVQPVCRPCHVARSVSRGSYRKDGTAPANSGAVEILYPGELAIIGGRAAIYGS